MASVSTQLKADLRLPRGLGEKLLLRCLAARRTVGLNRTALEPKRAIQFGSRIAKLEVAKEKGGDKASLLAAPAEKAKAGRPLGYALFALWAALMVGECAFGGEGGPWWVRLSSAFYRTGSLVWGGGQVVLPMLQC